MNGLKKACKQNKYHGMLRKLGYASLVLLPLFCVLVMDHFNFAASLQTHLRFIRLHPLSFLYEYLVAGGLFAVLLLLTKKSAIAGSILGVLSFLCAYVNYIKVAVNGDHFYPRDIVMAKNAGELVSFISGGIPFRIFLMIAFFAFWMFLLWLYEINLNITIKLRLPAALAILAVMALPFTSDARANAILGKFGMSFQDAFLQSSNYKANGFVGAFSTNLLSMHVSAPAGYSEQMIDEQLAPYAETPQTGEDYDVIVVLSESFSDVRALDGVNFSQNPLANYDALLQDEKCFSGTMYATAIGGGTVRPEFDILTGLTTDYLPSGSSPWEYAEQSFPTYVSNYKDAGYRTVAIHPYDKKFYSRNTAYPLIGFDEFYGLDELKEMTEISTKRGYATDASALDALKVCLDESDEPTFAFLITMQNHQPYLAMDPEQQTVKVTSDVLEGEVLDAVSTYTQGLYDADQMLGELTEYVAARERPTVLLFFGDHRPTLGANYAAYEQCGLFHVGDGLSTEERKTMFSTPFLIYSNRDLDTGILQGRTDNHISSYYLLDAVAVSTGAHRTPYMNFLLDFYKEAPMFNIRLELKKTESIGQFASTQEAITYDRLLGKKYSAEKSE